MHLFLAYSECNNWSFFNLLVIILADSVFLNMLILMVLFGIRNVLSHEYRQHIAGVLINYNMKGRIILLLLTITRIRTSNIRAISVNALVIQDVCIPLEPLICWSWWMLEHRFENIMCAIFLLRRRFSFCQPCKMTQLIFSRFQ